MKSFCSYKGCQKNGTLSCSCNLDSRFCEIHYSSHEFNTKDSHNPIIVHDFLQGYKKLIQESLQRLEEEKQKVISDSKRAIDLILFETSKKIQEIVKRKSMLMIIVQRNDFSDPRIKELIMSTGILNLKSSQKECIIEKIQAKSNTQERVITNEPNKKESSHSLYVQHPEKIIENNVNTRPQTVPLVLNQKNLQKDFELFEEFSLVSHTSPILAVCISPNATHFASSSQNPSIKLWNIPNFEEICELRGHSATVLCLGFSINSKNLVSGSMDKTIKIWNLASKSLEFTLQGHSEGIRSLAISPNGVYIASGSFDRKLKIWDFQSKNLLFSLEKHLGSILSVFISKNSNFIVTGSIDKTVKLWIFQQRSENFTFRGHNSSVTCVIMTADENFILSGSKDQTIKVWDLNKKQIMHSLEEHKGQVNSLSFLFNENYLISTSHDKTIKVWNLGSNRVEKSIQAHKKIVSSLSVSPQFDFFVSGSFDKSIKAWQVAQLD